MKRLMLLCLGCLPFAAGAAELAPPAALSKSTGANIATISSALSQHRKAFDQMVADRTEIIARVHRLTAEAQASAERDIAIYDNTGSKKLAEAFASLTAHGTKTASVPARIAAQEQELRADVAAATVIAPLSVAKLDAAAKKLAALAQQQPPKERLRELQRFAKDTRSAAKKLQEEAEAKAQAGNRRLNDEVAEEKTAAVLSVKEK